MTNLAFEELIQKLENSRQNKVGVVLDWTGILKSTCTFQLSLTLHSFSFQKHWTVINTFQNIVKSSCSSGEILWKCVNIWQCFSSVCQYKKYDVPVSTFLSFRRGCRVRRYDDAWRCKGESAKLWYCYRFFAFELLLLHLRSLFSPSNVYRALYRHFLRI